MSVWGVRPNFIPHVILDRRSAPHGRRTQDEGRQGTVERRASANRDIRTNDKPIDLEPIEPFTSRYLSADSRSPSGGGLPPRGSIIDFRI